MIISKNDLLKQELICIYVMSIDWFPGGSLGGSSGSGSGAKMISKPMFQQQSIEFMVGFSLSNI